MAECERRRAKATAEIETMKVNVRRGLLLADWPARHAANSLTIDWRQNCMEWFSVRQGPMILTRMQRPIVHGEQWSLHMAIQRVMRDVLSGVDRAVADGGGAPTT
jgi:hypothetical protein